MKKRGVVGLVFFLFLVLLPTAIAYHGLSGGLPLYPGSLTAAYIISNEDAEEEQLPGLPENFQELIGLPDLAVSKILIPDSLPKGTVIESFAVEIKNVGTNVARGYVVIDVEVKSRYYRCRNRLVAGGGISHPSVYLSARPMRYVELLPGQTHIVPYIISGRERDHQSACNYPVIDDVSIEATVNPLGGGFAGNSFIPKGRLDESDRSNNKVVKVVKIKTVAEEYDHTIRLVPGLNPFSVPVTTDLQAHKFRELTGCELMELLPEAFSSREQRLPDLNQARIVQDSETLEAGKPYLARCELKSYILLSGGQDPGPFNKELSKKGLNFLPTRMAMLNKKLSEFFMGCSGWGRDGTEVFSLVGGQRTFNLQTLSEKIPPESYFVPGKLYFATCSHGYGGNNVGHWDPSTEQIEQGQITSTGYAKGSEFYNTYNQLADPFRSQYRIKPLGVGSSPSAYRGYQYRYVSPYAYE